MIVFLIKMTVAKIDSGRKFHTLHVFLAELRYKFVSQPFPVFGRETPEGVNFWDEMYTHFKTDPNDKDDPRDLLIADGSANANMSMKEMSKYVRPYSISTLETNELLNGYTWREAYYLYPLGITDIRTGSADRDLNNSNLYQNLYWPIQAGGRAEK